MLEKTLESPFDRKEIQPVRPKGNQFWIFIGSTDPEAETPILWPLDVKNWLIGKDPNVGKDWRQGEKGMTEDEMIGWHYWLDGHEFDQALGVEWWTAKPLVLQSIGSQKLDMTEWLNWTELSMWCDIYIYIYISHQYVYILHLLYPLIYWWTLRCFHILRIVNNTMQKLFSLM